MLKKIIVVVVVVIGLLSLRFYQKKEQTQTQNVQEYFQTKRWKLLEAADAYRAYDNKRYEEEGVDAAYFPCPKGYDCEKLVPEGFKREGQVRVYDHCEGADCMDILKKTLFAYGVDDINEYLAARRINEGEPSCTNCEAF